MAAAAPAPTDVVVKAKAAGFCHTNIEGRPKLDRLITGRIGLDDVNSSFDRLRNGGAVRTVMTF